MPRKMNPSFHELDRRECEAILSRNHLGRIAFSFRDRVDIEPIHYAHSGDWLYIRTAPGAKALTMAHNRWVAFEVDEVAGAFDWRSVVVRGAAYMLDPEGAKPEQQAHGEGVQLLRAVVPQTFREDDPVPFRDLLIRIHIDEMSGREATTAAR